MNLENDQQLANSRWKLSQLESQLVIARARSVTDANQTSIQSLVQMANQLREEIVRYQSRQEQLAS